jgi:flagellar biosynthesis anti-sigma factor FlgM
MKVNGSNSVRPIFSVAKARPAAEQPQSAGPGGATDKVQLSGDARWISELRAQARQVPGVREELVAEVKAQLADGTFESTVDMDAVLDGLLADL